MLQRAGADTEFLRLLVYYEDMTYLRSQVLVMALALLATSASGATTVYRTVDRHGAVSFSDTPPAHATIPVLQLQIKTSNGTDEEAAGRLEAMRDTTERMIASRMARERHRAELRKLHAETELSRAAAAMPYPEDDDTIYREPLYLAPYRHQYVNHRPRPPLQMKPAPSPSSYPASLIRRHYNPQVRQVFE